MIVIQGIKTAISSISIMINATKKFKMSPKPNSAIFVLEIKRKNII